MCSSSWCIRAARASFLSLSSKIRFDLWGPDKVVDLDDDACGSPPRASASVSVVRPRGIGGASWSRWPERRWSAGPWETTLPAAGPGLDVKEGEAELEFALGSIVELSETLDDSNERDVPSEWLDAGSKAKRAYGICVDDEGEGRRVVEEGELEFDADVDEEGLEVEETCPGRSGCCFGSDVKPPIAAAEIERKEFNVQDRLDHPGEINWKNY
ncbi:hypothetical protein K438DRAFT_1755114 [Mycena galopus ATCC 62051]|nr:hypothetical protein K438DRAFT_1755114 [Mycena galopus ATCC 62051]